jgi:hypothetical protein
LQYQSAQNQILSYAFAFLNRLSQPIAPGCHQII